MTTCRSRGNYSGCTTEIVLPFQVFANHLGGGLFYTPEFFWRLHVFPILYSRYPPPGPPSEVGPWANRGPQQLHFKVGDGGLVNLRPSLPPLRRRSREPEVVAPVCFGLPVPTITPRGPIPVVSVVLAFQFCCLVWFAEVFYVLSLSFLSYSLPVLLFLFFFASRTH